MKSKRLSIFPGLSAKTPQNRVSVLFPSASIMWPDGRPEPSNSKREDIGWDVDLRLGEVVQAMTFDRRYRAFIHQSLLALNTDTRVIAWRQAILDDLLANPELTNILADLLPRMGGLGQRSTLLGRRERSLLLETSDRLAELDLYTETVESIVNALESATLQSDGLTLLLRELAALRNDAGFRNLRLQLPEMRAPFSKIASLTIGINLDTQLRPRSAVLIAVNDSEIGEPASFLERLVGIRDSDLEETGIAPVHQVPGENNQRILSPLFQDLDRLLTQAAQPVARELQRFARVSTEPLVELEFELAFYVGAVRLIERIGPTVNFCKPQILATETRQTRIEGLANINLALSNTGQAPVTSDVQFDDAGRIAILTGPNSGGKTTYLQSVGLAQAMFQAGLYVPAMRAQMSPVGTILTHFPALETRQKGRLAEEASRLRHLFTFADAQSLILLNETFSSTSAGEAVYLARDILAAMRVMGLRAIYATHFSELVSHIEQMEADIPGESTIYSLVAGVKINDEGNAVATFEIQRGMPLGNSYAREIARRYGISLEQLLDTHESESD